MPYPLLLVGPVNCHNKHQYTMHAAVKKVNKISTAAICDRFWEIRPKRGKQFFSVSRGKAFWVDFFFEKKIMAEMDRHQLALAYDAVVSSGVL